MQGRASTAMARLPGHNHSPECECGRPKTKSARACTRCTQLDGRTATSARIIAYLRTAGPSTVPELTREAGLSEAWTYREMRKLERAGRVYSKGYNPTTWALTAHRVDQPAPRPHPVQVPSHRTGA